MAVGVVGDRTAAWADRGMTQPHLRETGSSAACSSTLVNNALNQDLIWLRFLVKALMRFGNRDLVPVRPVDQCHDRF